MVCTRFGSSRQSRQLQASKASFLAGSESDVRHWHRGFRSAVGTGMPWCFSVSEAAAKAVSCRLRKRREAVAPGLRKRRWDRHAMVFTRFGSGRQSRQLQASKASFLAGSESDVRHWHRGFGSAVGTGMPWCFPVSEAAAKAVSCRLRKRRDALFQLRKKYEMINCDVDCHVE